MSRPKKRRNSPGTDQTPTLLLIVARHKLQLYRAFQIAFGTCRTVTVFLDRRREDGPWSDFAVQVDRRVDRRNPLEPASDVRLREYVLVRPYARRPHILPLTQS